MIRREIDGASRCRIGLRNRIPLGPERPGELRILREELVDEPPRVVARVAGRVQRPDVANDLSCDSHASSLLTVDASRARARCTLTLAAATEIPTAAAISS